LPASHYQGAREVGIFGWIGIGLVTGWIASKIASKTGSGMMMDVSLGLVGGMAGGFLAGLHGIGGVIGSIISAAIGAVAVLLIYDVLEGSFPKVDSAFVQFVSSLSILGRSNPDKPSDLLDPRSDIHAVARQTAVGLFDHIAQMSADAKFDATVHRDARVGARPSRSVLRSRTTPRRSRCDATRLTRVVCNHI
jgi:uncharacterized membrane protein YeaQ/YmgE (transglycosylase-associated protein family)